MTSKVVFIVGPTASGKSDLAKALIEKYSGEAISADSRQIYRSMDIGTGKDKTFFQHMIDICEPSDDYSVSEYQKQTYAIIRSIIKRGKLPVVVGGTGLYINSLIYGYQFPKTDVNIRTKIEKYSTEKLIFELQKVDCVSAEKYEKNHRRLARALESYLVNLRPVSAYRNKKPTFQFIVLGIDVPRKQLYDKIDARVDARIKEGMIEEVEKLLKIGISHEKLQRFGLEYRFIDDYLIGKLEKEEMIQKLKFRIHDFARRQLTWFRKNKEIVWVDSFKSADKIVQKYLSDH